MIADELGQRVARLGEAMARLTDDVRFIRGQLWAIIITIIIVGGGIITTLIALIGAVATD